MPIERYFIDDTLEMHAAPVLKGTEFHHLAHVMRTRVGDQIELVNGKGLLAHAVVQSIGKDQALASIEKIEEEPVLPGPIVLAQAFPKLNRLDFILEKGTELGVDEFWLFPGQLSQKKDFSANQLERAKMITIAAMKQCGRLRLPKIEILPELKKWPQVKGTALFGDLSEKAVILTDALQFFQNEFPLIFFVGPESGWSNQEIELLQTKGVKSVKLHRNVLRTDTASMMAMSIIQHWLLAKNN